MSRTPAHAMTLDDARRLLDQLGLHHACDLDLLIFFGRHPRTLLSSEALAGFLGYELKEIADSLDALMAADLLTRAQTPAHAARLYVFAADPAPTWLPPLLAFVGARDGRLALRRILSRRRRPMANGRGAAPAEPGSIVKPGPRRVVEPAKQRTGTA